VRLTGQECANEWEGEGNGEHRLHLNGLRGKKRETQVMGWRGEDEMQVLKICIGPGEGASREEKTEDRGERECNRKNKIPQGWEGNGIKTRGETASEKDKATQRSVPL